MANHSGFQNRRGALRLWAVILGTLLMGTLGGAPGAQAASNVVPDANFRRCLNKAIYGQDATWDLTSAELSSFTGEEVWAFDEPNSRGVWCEAWATGKITSVEGAQYLTRISGADLGDHNIADLSPLAKLTGLRDLALWGNRRLQFSQLRNMTSLRRLSLEETGIADLSPLAGLTNLTSLGLGGNAITSLAPLSRLTNLTLLSLSNFANCPGEEGSCYSGDKPQWSWVGTSTFRDLTPIASLTRLTSLSLSATKVTSLAALARLTNLTQLDVSSNQIGDVSPLRNLVKLEGLALNGNRIVNVAPLSGMARLSSLNLSVNRIANLMAIPFVQDWTDGGCDHNDQSPDWGCVGAAIAQTPEILVASPGTYAFPVAGRSGLTGAIRLKVKSGAASVNPGGTVTYRKAGSAVLTFADNADADSGTFTGSLAVHVLPATLALKGKARFGSTLTVPGVPSAMSSACLWLRNGIVIAGTTGCSHTVAVQDIGTHIVARVTVSNGVNLTYRLTNAVVPVAATFSKTRAPSLPRSARVGKSVTAKVAKWSPTPSTFSYQWYRNGAVIPAATAATYTPSAADLNTKLTVAVRGAKAGYATVSRTSKALKVHAGVLTAGKPSVSGTAQVGMTLTAIPGTWAPAPVAFRYQWYRGKRAIAGAVGHRYLVVAGDAGAKLKVKVTGSRPGYAARSQSASTAKIAPPR